MMRNHKLLHLKLILKASRSHVTQHRHPLCSRHLSYSTLSSSFSRPGDCELRTLLRPVMAKAHFFSAGMRSLVEDGLRTLKLSRWFKRWKALMSNPDNVTISLIGVNVAVFMLWKIADPTFMRKHFTVSLDNLKRGYIHTLVTSAFSHSEPSHLTSNMFGLYFFGTSIGRIFGSEFLLKFYLAGAVSGSAFFLIHNIFKSYRERSLSVTHGLGASAAVNAIILLRVFLFPKSKIYVYMFIPVNSALAGAFFIGSDIWAIKKGEGRSSPWAHLGGVLVAALAWYRIKKNLWKPNNIKRRY